MLAYFREPSPGAVTQGESAAARLFCAWCDGTDAFRNERFKLIPRVAKAALARPSAHRGTAPPRRRVPTHPAFRGRC